MTYFNKRNKLIHDLMLGRYIIKESDMDFIENRLKTKRPITGTHYSNRIYEDLFDSKKKYDKFMATLMTVEDVNFREDFINTQRISFIKDIGYEDSIRLLEAISRRKISAHNLLSNFPREIKYKEDFLELLFRVLKLKLEDNDVFRIVAYGNYRRILDSKNKNELLNQVDMLDTTKKIYNSNANVSVAEMLLKDLDCGEFLRFSKNTVDITGIGSATLCCFKKGGVGESLMTISLKSPIAGIILGKYNRITWFSYVWEMLEYDQERKTFNINLILDNIEANQTLTKEDYEFISKSLDEYNKYKTVYLGYLRNDIIIPSEIMDTKKEKPYVIPIYKDEVKKYEVYDDSKYIYTMINRKENIDKYRVEKITLGHMHRIQYIIDFVNEAKSKNIEFDFYLNKESKLANTKITKSTKINRIIDLDKSYIVLNDYEIKHFVLYDKEGNIWMEFN